MASVSNENIIQIPVRMGSNCFTIDVDERRTQNLTGYELIEMALNKCKLSGQLANTYYIYERANGVEQMLSRKADLINLWKKSTAAQEVRVEIVVRKMSSTERRLVVKRAKNQSVARKCFKKLNQLNEQPINEVNLYETIDQTEDEKMKYLKRIVRNEIKLQKQSMKLIEMEKSISERLQQVEHKLDSLNEAKKTVPDVVKSSCKQDNLKLRQNTNIVKSLIRKLKPSSLSYNKAAISISRTHLLSSDMNSCGNSSDDESDERKTNSRTSSTSTLESLV